MNDKSLECLKLYDMQIKRMAKGRGGVILFTSSGCRLFLECTRNDTFYLRDEAVTNAVKDAGFNNVDTYIRNEEGSLFTEGDDGRKYVMKRWFGGRECDVKSVDDIVETVRTLARLHISLNVVSARGVKVAAQEFNKEPERSWECMALAQDEDNEEVELKASESRIEKKPEISMEKTSVRFERDAGVRENLEKHTKELKKAANYMRGKKKKNEFEQIALGAMDDFYREAKEATEYISSQRFDDRFMRAKLSCELVHGSFNYHNVFLNAENNETAVTNFERCHNDCQIADLYQFLRKVMEKHDWNVDVAYRMVDEYDKLRPICDDDLDMLVALLRFPEKFWKIINQYYNAGKAWVPAKNIDKLKLVIRQNQGRRELIDKMCGV